MSYDEVISQVGKFGRYERRILLVLFLPAISCGFHKLGGVFLSSKADFRCLLPQENPENATYNLPPNIVFMSDQENNVTKNWPKCEKYNPNFSAQNHTSIKNISFTSHATVKCNSFVYDKTHYTTTATTEWNLVCDNAWLKTLSDSLFMLGDMPGVVIWGALSDKYGRKTALLWGSLMQLICGLLVAASPNLTAYMVFRVLVGITTSAMDSIAFVIVIEMVSSQNRLRVGIDMNLALTSGHVLSGVLAYFIRKWRILQVSFTVPILCLLALSWSIPESVRWLLSKGRVQEAKNILKKVSSENGKKLSEYGLDELLDNEEQSRSNIEKKSLIDLLKYPNLRKRSLLLIFIWFVNGTTYYGLALNTSNLGGDPYLNFIISAVMRIPANLFPLFASNKLGRKTFMCGGMLLSGVSLLLTFFVPVGMIWPMVSLAMIGTFAISCSLTVLYLFTTEIYPTAVRNVGFSACVAFARIGGAVAPFTNYLFTISTSLPLIIFGFFAIIAGLLTMLLPETLNKKLPETIQDGEQFGRKAST